MNPTFEHELLRNLDRIATALEVLASCTRKSGPEGHYVIEVDQPEGYVWNVDATVSGSLDVDTHDQKERRDRE